MSTPLAIAPYATFYPNREPYITVQEYITAPSAVNASNLVQGGNPQANQQELASVIARASSVADEYVFGQQGCLAATENFDGPFWLRVNRFGYVSFRCSYHPVLQINAISIGWSASTQVALTPQQATDINIHPTGVVDIPTFTVTNAGPVVPYAGWGVGSQLLVSMQYVNGYPNTTLQATVTAGATSIPVKTAAGIFPGSPLTIYDDGQGNETVTVASTYALGSTTVPLTVPLASNHSAGVSVSNMPPVVKQAVIALTSALIKTRGNLSIVMNQVRSSPGPVQQKDAGAMNDVLYAQSLLTSFKRVR